MPATAPRQPRRRRRRPPQRRGVIFIMALSIIVILSAMLLVYAQEMRTEQAAAANHVSAVQADAVEQGAEQWVLNVVETYTTPLSTGNTGQYWVGAGNTDITTIPAAALQVGNAGYFWCLSPIATEDQTYGFGIQDEGAKVNPNALAANTTTGQLQLINLPNMTQEAADSITDWVDTDENTTSSDGAESDYYGSLPESYQSKNGGLDTVDELLLVKGVTPNLLYGSDLNHDGVIDGYEQQVGGGGSGPQVTVNGSSDRRGFANYVTCYTTRQPPGQQAATSAGGGGRGGRTATKNIVGLINVNTAPEAVLMCLPGLQQSDADAMIAQRTQQAITGASTDLTWVSTALSQGQYNLVQPFITGTSYQYSADIVAVSLDGRAFKRTKIVVDARTQPAKIVYHKDLTDLGWPLPPDVRTSLRAGRGIPPDAQGSGDQGFLNNANSGSH